MREGFVKDESIAKEKSRNPINQTINALRTKDVSTWIQQCAVLYRREAYRALKLLSDGINKIIHCFYFVCFLILFVF